MEEVGPRLRFIRSEEAIGRWGTYNICKYSLKKKMYRTFLS